MDVDEAVDSARGGKLGNQNAFISWRQGLTLVRQNKPRTIVRRQRPSILKRIKKIMDPNNIMNPGKMGFGN